MADASDWTPNRVRGQHIAMWVKGLPENADRNNVRVTLGGEPLTVEFVETGAPETARQVNARRKGATGMPGTQRLEVHLGPVSASLHVPVD
jgi:hypothetical protein